MKVSDFTESSIARQLRRPGIWFRTGPFCTHLQTPIESVARAFHALYADFPLVENDGFADFHVRVASPRGFRRWHRPQALFFCDGERPFKPLDRRQAFAMFEWGFNWCVSSYAHQYVIIHAAIIERRGRAAILAAPPGSGKSTLTAALIGRGWRLLSDELTLIDPSRGLAVAIARPVSLKNASIDLIRGFTAGAVIGPRIEDTAKGAVAHLKPPADSVYRMDEPALPYWVVFPKFQPGANTSLASYPKANAFLRLADHAFNYCQHGVRAFHTFAELIDRCACYEFTYSNLDEAVAVFDALASGAPAATVGV